MFSLDHHAYVYSSGERDVLPVVLEAIREVYGIDTTGANPDFTYTDTYQFDIEQARSLGEWSRRKPFGERKVHVIRTQGILLEAQHALLKTLEEPSPQTHFIFILPSAQSLLPTVRSRVQVIGSDSESAQASNFLTLSLEKRKKVIDALLAGLEDEKFGRAQVSQFCLGVFNELMALGQSVEAARIGELSVSLNERGVSVKYILEYILYLPQLRA